MMAEDELDFSVNSQVVNMDEFDEASPMKAVFCHQMSEAEYEEQAFTETDKALQELMQHLEKDPTSYKKLLRKRKKEEVENAGLFSFLKSKMLVGWQGNSYVEGLVSEAECSKKLQELKSGMTKAFEYSQVAKGRRFSRRIAARRGIHDYNDENTPIRGAAPPPIRGAAPPPPPPLPPLPKLRLNEEGDVPPTPPPFPPPKLPALTPLRNIQNTTPMGLRVRALKNHARTGSTASMTSIGSVHEELLSSNPLKRLKATKVTKSPGGTPVKRTSSYRNLNTSTSSFNTSGDSLTKAFLEIMHRKFQNVRTPSPGIGLNSNPASPYSPGNFTP